MKKKLMIISSIIILGCGNLFAQNDSFFSYSSDGNSDRNVSWGMTPALPTSHGMTDDQNAAPLGSGIVLLAGMALAYGRKRRIDN